MTRTTSRVGIRELKARLGAYLRRVRQGQTLIVTDRGAPVAEIRPLPPRGGTDEERLEELVRRGVLRRDTHEALPPFRPIPVRGEPVAKTVVEGREEESL